MLASMPWVQLCFKECQVTGPFTQWPSFLARLNQAQQNYSATDREMLAIVEALRFWQHLLHGLEFKVRTDHKPLSSFFTQPNLSGR